MTIARQDLTRITLAVLSIGLLILGSLWILRPFLGAVIWATMVVVASWPMLRWLQARLWGRRWLATAMMTSALMLMFVVPLTLAIGTIVLEADRLIAWGKGLAALRLSPPPEFLQKIPFIGGKIAAAWEQALAAGAEGLTARLAPYANDIVRWFVSEVGGAGFLVVQFLLTVVLAGLMYSGGEGAAITVRRFGRRLAGERGENAIVLAGQAIRAVALGVGVTAVVQSVLGGVGLAIAGVPFAGLLTALMFMLCIAQLGPALVLIPAVIDPDQARRRPAAAADPRRRHRRPGRLRPGGHLRRASAAGRGLQAAPGVDRRGRRAGNRGFGTAGGGVVVPAIGRIPARATACRGRSRRSKRRWSNSRNRGKRGRAASRRRSTPWSSSASRSAWSR